MRLEPGEDADAPRFRLLPTSTGYQVRVRPVPGVPLEADGVVLVSCDTEASLRITVREAGGGAGVSLALREDSRLIAEIPDLSAGVHVLTGVQKRWPLLVCLRVAGSSPEEVQVEFRTTR